MADIHQVFVSYEEAQHLLPAFRWYSYTDTLKIDKDIRADARRIHKELSDVRPIEYALGGKQIMLTERQAKFLEDVRAELGK
jgi:hypothetical protein